MRKILTLIFVLNTLLLYAYDEDSLHVLSCDKKNYDVIDTTSNQIVYICTGAYSYAYHSVSNCPGLGNCQGTIIYMDENTAVYSYGRVPCCRCWSNVSNRCKDDNPYSGYGGGDDSGIYILLAAAVVATGVVLISNDIYAYPILSFDKSHELTGVAFGLRKTFKYCAFEYGASYIPVSPVRHGYDYDGYDYGRSEWNGHLNFVQQLFYHKTPDWLRFYLGGTFSFNDCEVGGGGIIGAELRICNRLKFDIRYEYSSRTNQLQAGLIFKYQKKYLWQK